MKKYYNKWIKVPAHLVSISREIEKIYEFGKVSYAIPSKPDIIVKGHDDWIINDVKIQLPDAYVSVLTECEDKEANWMIV